MLSDLPTAAAFILSADAAIFILWLIFVIRKAPLKFHYAMVCASLGIWLLGLGIACSLLRAFGNTMGETGVGDPSRLARLLGDALIMGATATHTVVKLLVLGVIGLVVFRPKTVAISGEAAS